MSAAVALKRIFHRPLLNRVRDFSGNVQIGYENADFAVSTAKNGRELRLALELRHEVFIREWQGRSTFTHLDVDDFDFHADHLIITDKRSEEIVGTYRLLSSQFTENFYSASEFSMTDFQRQPGVKLEMGRACVHKNYRDGRSIDLLWKGLSQYIENTSTEFLFGCSSLKTESAEIASRLVRTLRDQGTWTDDFSIRPNTSYVLPNFDFTSAEGLSAVEKRHLLPPLLRSYLHAGARVHGWPALDRDFACLDLFTVLDWKNLNQRFHSRFATA